MLEARGITIKYHQRLIIQNLSLNLEPGTVTMLAGRNGSGKSSLLRLLAGLQIAFDGHIMLNSRPLSQLDSLERAGLISIVFSNPPQVEFASAYEMALMAIQHRFSIQGQQKSNMHESVMQALETCGIREFANTEFIRLSDGEKQKVMLAAGLAQKTPVLLLDEPLAFLDYPARVEMLTLLQSLANQGKTIMFSSHDLDISLKFCDQLLLLGKGSWTITTGREEIQKISPSELFSGS